MAARPPDPELIEFYFLKVRQGDPISPMIFILAMDSLNSLFVKAEELGLLQPLGIPHRVSLYADDVVAFVKPTVGELQ
ncbi:hypothetical protein OsJ_30414 [Oryza sativa Japonica Group]|uniref:Reverse transcriptase domain-containing protein n=1 Tax=Oryza sativa subsp. japonica TaxID=39947 RepID=A3C1P5_ORYSJ|nr:hypothetical protein OsJ_30414 [Oryza sativa Japonica Group]